jgi:hypothetical protein
MARLGAPAIAAAIALGAAAARAEAPQADAPAPSAGGSAKSAFFPLPMYTTVPNEGSTYGVMPVLMRIGADQAVRWILAPSVSWNHSAGVNGTFRFYRYPSRVKSWSIVAAASTKVNRTLWVEYYDLPIAPGTITVEGLGQVRRNIFYRYFGEGPETPHSAESSYTRMTENATTRVGVNLPAHFNAGLRLTVRHDRALRHAIEGLPLTHDAFPDAPGLGGAAMAAAGASLRYDTRAHGDYSDEGVAIDVTGTYAYGIEGFAHLWRLTGQARALLRETDRLQGAGRLYWTDQTGGRDTPFFYQSTLGGEVLLRGFTQDRFIDRGAWEAELEQRIRFLRTHFFNVTADWRVDPFVAAGQVYPRGPAMFQRPRLAAGAGLRAWVQPNVLGRIDVAYASDGAQAYIVLGYPY